MTVTADVAAARSFLAGHGRVLERRRFELLIGDGGEGAAVQVLVALDAYRNPDGGYGWGLEPDLRSPESQPLGAMHAFEILAEVARASGPTSSPRAVELCDWLAEHTLEDGGLPFTLPVADPAGCSPVWLGEDHTTSSLQMTAQVAATAHLVARMDRRVAEHPWLARATAWCVDTIGRIDGAPAAHELLFAVRFLDAFAAVDPVGETLLDQLSGFIPADGVVPVDGGTEDEAIRPMDLAPRAGAARRRFTGDIVAADLARLARGQQPDGGWTVDFTSPSPAATIEWRGIATFDAVATLLDAGDGAGLAVAGDRLIDAPERVNSTAPGSLDLGDARACEEFFGAVYDRFNARDIEWLLERMTPDVEWPNVRAGTQLAGREAVRRYWLDQWVSLDPQVRPIRVTEDHGRFDVEVHQVIRRADDGAIIAVQIVHHVYELRDGKVAAMSIGH